MRLEAKPGKSQFSVSTTVVSLEVWQPEICAPSATMSSRRTTMFWHHRFVLRAQASL